MIKISQALEELISKNNFLYFGLAHQLLNLSQTAEWIKPLVEARIKKDVSSSAILMALSRMGKIKNKILPRLQEFYLRNINVYNNLYELTFVKSLKVESSLDRLYLLVQEKGGYITISQSMNEVTIIVSMNCVATVKKLIKSETKFEKKHLAALGIQFDSKHVEAIGMLYYLIQQLTLQNINIWEFSSTYTEIIFYVAEKDLPLAFDTIYRRFGQNI